MPMNLANKITMLRIFMIPIFLFVYLSNFIASPLQDYLACAIFVIASATDALDGYIARSRNLVSNFGKFMDPLADKLLVSSALISLLAKGQLSAIVVIIIISREFIVTGFRLVAAAENLVIAASIWGKVKTVLQMTMVAYLLFGLQNISSSFKMLSNVLIIACTVATVFSGMDYIIKNLHVLKE